MSTILVNPMEENVRSAGHPPPRLKTLKGKTIGILDISKWGGKILFDRLHQLLKEKAAVGAVIWQMKPTFAKKVPDGILNSLTEAKIDAALVGLAD